MIGFDFIAAFWAACIAALFGSSYIFAYSALHSRGWRAAAGIVQLPVFFCVLIGLIFGSMA